jgi:hypothetical protein
MLFTYTVLIDPAHFWDMRVLSKSGKEKTNLTKATWGGPSPTRKEILETRNESISKAPTSRPGIVLSVFYTWIVCIPNTALRPGDEAIAQKRKRADENLDLIRKSPSLTHNFLKKARSQE